MELKKYTYSKFWLAEQFDFDKLPVSHNLIKNTGKSVAITYHLWNTEAYMPYIYYSILSQLAYTDASKEADIYLFVQEEFYDYTVYVFRNLLDKNCIIKVSREEAQKDNTLANSILQNYEVVISCDADLFFKSNDNFNSFEFYRRLKKYYENYEGIIVDEIHEELLKLPIFIYKPNRNIAWPASWPPKRGMSIIYLDVFDSELKFSKLLIKGNEFNTDNLNVLKQIERDFKIKRNKENTNLVVSRSWREFKEQQFVAICELVNKFEDYKLDIHININLEIDQVLLKKLDNYLLESGHVLTIYTDNELDQYALKNGATQSHLAKFKEWGWIYHLLLYHKLYYEFGVNYLLTYDDDIFFNEKPIGELLYLVNNQVPFACADQYADSDKCMMGKLCVLFGAEINDEYYANTSALYSTNSGLMGLDNTMFSKFETGDNFRKMLDLFEYRKWDHKTMSNLGYDDYKILLQEQSFLGILNRVFSNRTHRILDEHDEYIISSDLEQIRKSKVEHYVSVSKYSDEYSQKLQNKLIEYTNKIETLLNQLV
jgi:hypothetical protein